MFQFLAAADCISSDGRSASSLRVVLTNQSSERISKKRRRPLLGKTLAERSTKLECACVRACARLENFNREWDFADELVVLPLRFDGIELRTGRQTVTAEEVRELNWHKKHFCQISATEGGSEITPTNILTRKDNGRVFSFHAMAAYSGSRRTAPLILNVGIRWSWVINLTPRPL